MDLDRLESIPFLWTYVPIRITYTEVCKNFHLVMVSLVYLLVADLSDSMKYRFVHF